MCISVPLDLLLAHFRPLSDHFWLIIGHFLPIYSHVILVPVHTNQNRKFLPVRSTTEDAAGIAISLVFLGIGEILVGNLEECGSALALDPLFSEGSCP